MKPRSIRTKSLWILLGMLILLVSSFAVYAATSSARYQELRTLEMTQTVAFESEHLARVIAEMDRNAIDLALAGRQFYKTTDSQTTSGAELVTLNFEAFDDAAGGGIWFTPNTFTQPRVAFYAYRDGAGNVRYDPNYSSAAYDYPNQKWFTTLTNAFDHEGVGSRNDDAAVARATAWAAPFFDDVGAHALMTTVGAGIFNDAGALVGVSTVDWEIDSVVERLKAIHPTEGSFILLATPEHNRVIVNTSTNALSGGFLSNVPWAADLSSRSTDTVETSSITLAGTRYLTFTRHFDNGWLYSVQVPRDELFAESNARNLRYSLALGLAIAAAAAITWLLMSKMVTKPLHELSDQVLGFGTAGDFDTTIPVTSNDEIGALATAFNRMTADLRDTVAQRVAAVAEKERIGTELSVAHEIQSAILPHTFPAFPAREEFDIYACMYPQREIGGDFYDFFLTNDNTLAIVIADVSGKGVPAALFMMGARTLIRNTVLAGKQPAQALFAVNNALCDNNEAAMFVTAFLGCLDLRTGKLNYANAGHNRPILIQDGNRENPVVSFLQVSPGFVLGGVPDFEYEAGELVLSAGDALLLYTDGVTEAANSDADLYGDQRLILAVTATCGNDVAEQCELIRDDVSKFVAGCDPADDLTMLLVRYDGSPRSLGVDP